MPAGSQVFGAAAIIYFLGFILSQPWTRRLFSASLIKLLYKVKHTSSGRELDKVPKHLLQNSPA
jgi:hypothetical protein